MKKIQLDRDVLQSLYGDCRENMIEIFSDFLESYPETKKSLFAAYNSGNLTSLKRVLHYHGPSFMYLGLPEIAAQFKSLEQQCCSVNINYALSKDFTELMESVEESWLQAKNEMCHIKKEV